MAAKPEVHVGVRASPILMTTLAAVLALFPLTLRLGAGAQMQRSLAIAMIEGLSVSRILLLFGLSLIYRMFQQAE
ncbi:MAG TPA: efflux RND transporter permease subunit [Bacteroidota bacterium]|nr:efflux RND transporter permease subunit [Bacteroidota bacterium]